jgi:hypothetical protein
MQSIQDFARLIAISVSCRTIISRVVKFCVCFGCNVADAECLNFSRGFYSALVNGRNFAAAYTHATNKLHTHALKGGAVPMRASVKSGSKGKRGKTICMISHHTYFVKICSKAGKFVRSVIVPQSVVNYENT